MLSFSGLVYASLAALLWGFVPVYIGYLGDVDPMEIVVHRALWSASQTDLLLSISQQETVVRSISLRPRPPLS